MAPLSCWGWSSQVNITHTASCSAGVANRKYKSINFICHLSENSAVKAENVKTVPGKEQRFYLLLIQCLYGVIYRCAHKLIHTCIQHHLISLPFWAFPWHPCRTRINKHTGWDEIHLYLDWPLLVNSLSLSVAIFSPSGCDSNHLHTVEPNSLCPTWAGF